MSEAVIHTERGPPARIGIMSGRDARAPKNFVPLLLVAPLVVFLASDMAAGITGQCIGLGGDKLALWSHPREVSIAYKNGGWTADEIATAWQTAVGLTPETYGLGFLQRQ